MLDSDFKNVVTLRKARAGSRKNATEVVYDRVVDADSNEPIRIRCRFKRSASKSYGTKDSEDQYDATLLFKVAAARDISQENVVICDRGEAYKVLSVTEEEDLELSTTYKQLRLKKIDLVFAEDPEDVR
jgi:hypothetical protein